MRDARQYSEWFRGKHPQSAPDVEMEMAGVQRGLPIDDFARRSGRWRGGMGEVSRTGGKRRAEEPQKMDAGEEFLRDGRVFDGDCSGRAGGGGV